MIRQRIAGEAWQSSQPKFQNLFPRSPNRLVIHRLDSALNAFKASPASFCGLTHTKSPKALFRMNFSILSVPNSV
jgi:hypothetical protein